jgi:hypothetical protein
VQKGNARSSWLIDNFNPERSTTTYQRHQVKKCSVSIVITTKKGSFSLLSEQTSHHTNFKKQADIAIIFNCEDLR